MADPTNQTTSLPASKTPTGVLDYDPLASLHKMSMTAGLGSQDYVAINNTSFAAVIFGLVGTLALFWPVMLVSSGIGLACAIVSWFQIRRSNGTQTGKSIVLLAVLLCLGIGGYVAGHAAEVTIENKQDTREIGQLIDKFSRYLQTRQYDQAYSLCSDEFRNRVSFDKFSKTFDDIIQHPLGNMGSLDSLKWNGAPDWFGNEANGDRIAVALTLFSFKNSSEPSRQNVSFLDVHDENGWHWEVNDIPSLFPKPRKSTGGPPGMPQAGDASPEGPALQQ